MRQSKLLKIIIVLLALLVGCIFFGLIYLKYFLTPKINSDIKINTLRAGQKPSVLPSDFPLPDNVVYLKNFEGKSLDGTTQGTIEYISDKSTDNLIREFQRYMVKKRFTPRDVVKQGGRVYLGGYQDEGFLNIDLTDNGSGTIVSVTIINSIYAK